MERSTTSRTFSHRSARVSPTDRHLRPSGENSHVTTLRGRSVIAEEAMEFELPAIFKVSSQPAPERPNLLGRLSEALSSSGQQHDWERSRTVIPFEPAHGRMIEPPPVVLQAVSETPAKMADKVCRRKRQREARHADLLRYADKPHERDDARTDGGEK